MPWWADPGVQVLAALAAPVVAAALVGGVVLVQWWRDPGLPVTPVWEPLDLGRLMAGLRGGQHRVLAAVAWQALGVDRGHQPRHALECAPEEVRVPLGMMAPVERARELTRQLGTKAWRPAGPPPAWARRVQLELARRLRAAGPAGAVLP